jgi:23S rRNA pseudouridine1911/1915/1917 synthase
MTMVLWYTHYDMDREHRESLLRQVVILADQGDLLVIQKPVGLVVHPTGKTDEPTVIDWIRRHYPDIEGVGEPMTLMDGTSIDRPGIVHRLDRDTSGVMLIAKTKAMHAWLKEQFMQRKMKKEYRAFVHGIIVEDTGKIDRAIGRSASDFRRFSAQRGAKGEMRDAITRYTVLARLTENKQQRADWNRNGYSYVALFPLTGRTHQLRVHMKSITHPIIADALYAGALGTGLDFTNLALHAFRISVPLPGGAVQTFEAPLREDFIRALS